MSADRRRYAMFSKESIRISVKLVLALAICCGTCTVSGRYVSRLRPISRDNLPWSFWVVGKDGAGNYSVYELYECSAVLVYERSSYGSMTEMAEYVAANSRWPMIWDETAPNYDYYIPKSKVDEVAEAATAHVQRAWGTRERIRIKILKDDASNKRQTILLTKYFPDAGTFRHLYEAAEGEVVPLKYGEFTKREAFGAVPLSGIIAFIIICIALSVYERGSSRYREKSQASDRFGSF